MSVFGSQDLLETSAGRFVYYRLARVEELGVGLLERLPVSVKVLLEGVLRRADSPADGGGRQVGVGGHPRQAERSRPEEDDTLSQVEALIAPSSDVKGAGSVTFSPHRVVLQDYTGIPALLGLASMRSSLHRQGGDPALVDVRVPTDLVIDHSIQADYAGYPGAHAANLALEYERNAERFRFARWAERAFARLRVVPPGKGIVHQVNMEFLASVAAVVGDARSPAVVPDTVVGTDSHTTMIGGLGVLGWGVGGIEAEAVMLGEPLSVVAPEVVGVRLLGAPGTGVTATDIVLALTRRLREVGVTGSFVEFCGSALDRLSLVDRATVANMAPEYGATVGYFPPDAETLRYLLATGRNPVHVDLIGRYCRAQGMFREPGSPEPTFDRLISFDLSTVEPLLAGPYSPQQTLALSEVASSFRRELSGGERRCVGLSDGHVVIAAITSCTNTSNPALMLGAGLLARNAVRRGLSVPAHVKTSLAPGSPVVADYLGDAGLLPWLEKLGFAVVGYGCTTCAGGSGPLAEQVENAVVEGGLTVAAVLSGNRNFPGRIHSLCRLAYLASPPLVVAYAIAGTVACDLATEPLGTDEAGQPVYLEEIWPGDEEITELTARVVKPELFARRSCDIFCGDERWQSLPAPESLLPYWSAESTYLVEPPFSASTPPELPASIEGARCLLLLGDGITTDHISPAALIPPDSPAGRYLLGRGVPVDHFGSLGARRGNHEVMTRATFANPRLRNEMTPEVEGGWALHHPSGDRLAVYDASRRYQEDGTPLLVIAGEGYGAGSSRDWAAKGTTLLGVRAVVASSFERLHRQNLICMGVLPLQFEPGCGWREMGLTGEEVYDLPDLLEVLDAPATRLTLCVRSLNGQVDLKVPVTARLENRREIDYYRSGGIAPFVMRRLLSGAAGVGKGG